MSGLEAVLAAHWSYEPTKNYDGWLCECGVLIMRGNEGDTDAAMHVHTAAAIEEWLRAELAAEGMREAVVDALDDTHATDDDWHEHATAALDAITARLAPDQP